MAKSKLSAGDDGTPADYLSVEEVKAIRLATARLHGTKLPGPKATPVDRAKFDVIQKLLHYMYSHELTQGALAKKLGIPSPRLSKLLHNRTQDVTLDYLLRLYQRVYDKLVVRIA